MMKAADFYKYTTWALLLLNLCLIAFFLWNKPPPQRGSGPQFKNKLIEQLNLDDDQKEEFLVSANNHMQNMGKLAHKKQDHLNRYFGVVNGTLSPDQVESEIIQIEDIERKMLETTTQHLSEIKSLLNPDQEQEFDLFLDEFVKNIMPPSGRQNHTKPKK